MQNRSDTGLSETIKRHTYYEDSLSAAYDELDFVYDLRDLDLLVRSLQLGNPSVRIVLITLAGMFDWRNIPDEKALQWAIRSRHRVISTPTRF